MDHSGFSAWLASWYHRKWVSIINYIFQQCHFHYYIQQPQTVLVIFNGDDGREKWVKTTFQAENISFTFLFFCFQTYRVFPENDQEGHHQHRRKLKPWSLEALRNAWQKSVKKALTITDEEIVDKW
jgi:hypothetical protein